MKNKTLDGSFIFRGPVWITAVLVLAFIPYFANDYELCYVQLKAQDPTATLFGFIRHVLVEKFFIGVTMTIALFTALYLINQWLDNARSKIFHRQLGAYILYSIPILALFFGVYWMIQLRLQEFFSVHHVAESLSLVEKFEWSNLIYFWSLGLGLMLANVMQSVLVKLIDFLEVSSPQGKVRIEVNNIVWIEKVDEVCHIKTGVETFESRLTIKQLNSQLDPKKFIQINRAAIINQSVQTSFTYWENHKYTLYVGEEKKEFVVTRNRLKQIKKFLNLAQ